jgi:CheY-like chemotaxis protein
MQNSKPILLVENDNVDVMTVKRAPKDLKVSNQQVLISNGEEAIKHLKKENTTKPCFVLPDLNMPKMNKAEFLKTVKADKTLKKIPIVMLTTSNSEQYENFVETIQAIEQYWTLSKLPWNGD